MTEAPLLHVEIPGLAPCRSGKVREVFDLEDSLLLVATDRISAFDCILPNGIPRKGEVLTQISQFWFNRLEGRVANHRMPGTPDAWPPRLASVRPTLDRRSMWVRKAQPIPFECVVRGYLAGSAWAEYRQSGTVCGQPMSPGLRESEVLPEPLFTPATKAESGHDENIPFSRMAQVLGQETADRLRTLSLDIYTEACRFAADRGILIADTKFEFGWWQDQLLLIDEVLTPDSSRFWPAASYEPGRGQPSFDKQFVRDYLLTLDWDRTPPAPALPEDIVARTSAKYLEAFELLTGRPL
jgi:phosphoribosylaminoimidazole-succinocarboxamide synthase